MPKAKATRSCFYLGMNRRRCQKPPVSADGGSRRSYSPAAVLPQPGVPVDILDLRVLRSRAAVLQGSVSRPGAAPAASRGQPASSAKRRGATGSSRPSEAVSCRQPSHKKRDGSGFSIGFISFTIGGVEKRSRRRRRFGCVFGRVSGEVFGCAAWSAAAVAT